MDVSSLEGCCTFLFAEDSAQQDSSPALQKSQEHAHLEQPLSQQAAFTAPVSLAETQEPSGRAAAPHTPHTLHPGIPSQIEPNDASPPPGQA